MVALSIYKLHIGCAATTQAYHCLNIMFNLCYTGYPNGGRTELKLSKIFKHSSNSFTTLTTIALCNSGDSNSVPTPKLHARHFCTSFPYLKPSLFETNLLSLDAVKKSVNWLFAPPLRSSSCRKASNGASYPSSRSTTPRLKSVEFGEMLEALYSGCVICSIWEEVVFGSLTFRNGDWSEVTCWGLSLML